MGSPIEVSQVFLRRG